MTAEQLAELTGLLAAVARRENRDVADVLRALGLPSLVPALAALRAMLVAERMAG